MENLTNPLNFLVDLFIGTAQPIRQQAALQQRPHERCPQQHRSQILRSKFLGIFVQHQNPIDIRILDLDRHSHQRSEATQYVSEAPVSAPIEIMSDLRMWVAENFRDDAAAMNRQMTIRPRITQHIEASLGNTQEHNAILTGGKTLGGKMQRCLRLAKRGGESVQDSLECFERRSARFDPPGHFGQREISGSLEKSVIFISGYLVCHGRACLRPKGRKSANDQRSRTANSPA